MFKILGFITLIIGIVSLFVGFYALVVFLFQWVWNMVMPMVFSLPEISFWVAAGLVFLLGFIGKAVSR